MFVLSGFLVYKSPVGAGIVKEYIFSKITFLKNFEIKSFNYSFNNFSIDLQKSRNTVRIFGNLFPFNAVYEAKLMELEKVTDNFQGSLLSSGSIKYDNCVNISGNTIVADGYGEFKLKLDRYLNGNFKGSGFNVQKIFYLLKISFPYLVGTVDLDIDFVQNLAKTKFIQKGNVVYKNTIIPVKLNGNIFAMDRQNYKLQSKFLSPAGNGDIFLTNKDGTVNFKGTVSGLNLAKLQKITLYPFGYHADVTFDYSEDDNILNFKSRNFEGYYNKALFIQLKHIPSEVFFKYANVKPFIKGSVTGSISIGENEGEYNILFSNGVFLPNKVINYVRRTCGANFNKPHTVFVKGNFDKYHLVFNLLSKTPDYSVSVEEGLYSYNGNYNFTLTVVRNNRLYKYDVNNAGIKLIKVRNLNSTSSETLVY